MSNKTYRLLKDLPTFKAGDEFFISEKGNLVAGTPEKPKKVLVGDGYFVVPTEIDLMAYAKETLQQFPNILTEWFEEIKSSEIPDELDMGFWTIMYGEDGFYTWHLPSDEFEEEYEEMLKHHMEIGWAFKTKEEAEKHLEWLKARATLLEDTKGSKHGAFNVFYNTVTDFGVSRSVDYITPMNFDTREDAENSIKNHIKEWKIYFGAE